MTRIRTLLRQSPGVSALAGMIALIAVVWAAPEIGAHRANAEQVRPIA